MGGWDGARGRGVVRAAKAAFVVIQNGVCAEEHAQLRDIQRLLRREIPSSVVEGFTVSVPASTGNVPQRHPQAPVSGRRHGPAERGRHARPQKSAEHRAGKSRKVH